MAYLCHFTGLTLIFIVLFSSVVLTLVFNLLLEGASWDYQKWWILMRLLCLQLLKSKSYMPTNLFT